MMKCIFKNLANAAHTLKSILEKMGNMHNINLEHLKKLNSSLNYKITGAAKLFEGTKLFIHEIENNYHKIIDVLKMIKDEKILNDFNFLFSKLKEHQELLGQTSYIHSSENLSNGSIKDFRILHDKIKSRRRELYSILHKIATFRQT